MDRFRPETAADNRANCVCCGERFEHERLNDVGECPYCVENIIEDKPMNEYYCQHGQPEGDPCDECAAKQEGVSELAAPTGYAHPTSIQEFEAVYRAEYEQELESCDGWIKWCEHQKPPDTHGMNFHQGLRSAHIFNNIKMEQLLRVLKQEAPNAASGHNDQADR